MSRILKFFMLSCVFSLSVYGENLDDYRERISERVRIVLDKLEENNYEHESDPGLKWHQGYYCGLVYCLNESYLIEEE